MVMVMVTVTVTVTVTMNRCLFAVKLVKKKKRSCTIRLDSGSDDSAKQRHGKLYATLSAKLAHSGRGQLPTVSMSPRLAHCGGCGPSWCGNILLVATLAETAHQDYASLRGSVCCRDEVRM